MGKNPPVPDDSRILIYQSESGETRLEVRLQEETVWLTQRLMAELYQVSVKTVNEHLVNIYNEGELAPQATIRKFRIVQTEGARRVSRMVDHYNLDAILAVGYRVRSTRGTAFRQWATVRLREYIVNRSKRRREVTLDSYIISATPFKVLRKRYDDGTWDKKKFADAHILFQERSGEYDYIKTIFLSQAIR